MTDWTKIISFTYPHEAHMAKAKLESEGIEVQIRDELTAQVNNFYSGAIGGVKLFVQQSDFEKAYHILLESGYIREEEPSENKLLVWIDKFTARFPYIGKSILEIRLIAFIMLILVIVATPIIISSIPSQSDKLTENQWCVDKMYYNGKELSPNTIGFIIISPNNCQETMSFNKNGQVTFPGINSGSISACWLIQNDYLIIYDESYNESIFDKWNTRNIFNEDRHTFYQGRYKLIIKNNLITMQSDSLTITGTAILSRFRF